MGRGNGEGREQLASGLYSCIATNLAGEHLVEEDAVRPPIDRSAVRLVVDDLKKKGKDTLRI